MHMYTYIHMYNRSTGCPDAPPRVGRNSLGLSTLLFVSNTLPKKLLFLRWELWLFRRILERGWRGGGAERVDDSTRPRAQWRPHDEESGTSGRLSEGARCDG